MMKTKYKQYKETGLEMQRKREIVQFVRENGYGIISTMKNNFVIQSKDKM